MNALQTVKVNETDISVKEYHGKRVVTFKDIGACHNRAEGTARKREELRTVENEYRHFKIINDENKEAFESLVTDKNLSREDLILILSTIEINRDIFQEFYQAQ